MKGYAFREVSGIEAKMEIQTVSEGGVNMFEHKLVGRTNYENLILKRGLNPIEITDALYLWLTGTFTVNSLLLLPVVAQPSVIISLLDSDGVPAASWNFMNVYPIRWDVSDFNSEDDGIIIEEIEFAYNTFQRLPVSGVMAIGDALMNPRAAIESMVSSVVQTVEDTVEFFEDVGESIADGFDTWMKNWDPLKLTMVKKEGDYSWSEQATEALGLDPDMPDDPKYEPKDVSFPGFNDGQASAVASDGKPPYTFEWSNGEEGEIESLGDEKEVSTAKNLSAGIHKCTVTDADGDTKMATIEIKEPKLLTARVLVISNVTIIGGDDGEAKVVASGGKGELSYLWQDGTDTEINSNLPAGIHIVRVTDEAEQSVEARVKITEPLPLSAKASERQKASDGTIADGMAKVYPVGGVKPYIIKWDNDEEFSIAKNLTAGIHSVTVTDKNGDEVTVEVEITYPELSAEVEEISPVSVFGKDDGVAKVTASGGTGPYTYEWDNGETTSEASNLTGGVHAVKVIDDGGDEVTVTVKIHEPFELTLTAEQVTPATGLDTPDGVAKAIAKGGTEPYSYEWDNDETEDEALALTPGEHIVKVTDAAGTEVEATVIIGKPELTAVITEQTDATTRGGEDGSATVEASGGSEEYTYEWDNGETEATATKLTPGNHTVKVTDSDGAEVEVNVYIGEPTPLTARAVEISPVSIDGTDDGQAEAIVEGGTEPYTFRWDNGETEASAKNLDEGTHEVIVTDAAGDSVTSKVRIHKLIALTAEAIEEKPVTEAGGSDGIAKVTAKGGFEPYEYLWDASAGDQTTERAIGLPAGTYKVKVTDAEGTEVEVEVTITEPE